MVSAKLLSVTPNYMKLLKAACSKPYGNNVSEKEYNPLSTVGTCLSWSTAMLPLKLSALSVCWDS